MSTTDFPKIKPKKPAPVVETKYFDVAQQGAVPEAGFIVGAEEGIRVYPWMCFSGGYEEVPGKRSFCLKMGSEEVIIEYPEAFPIEAFMEAVRTQRLLRIYSRPEQNVNIQVVDVEEES